MLFHPHLSATGTATERIATVAFGFNINAADGVAGRIQFAADASEVARVVEGHRAVVLGLREFTFGLQVADELGVVHDFDVFAAVVLVLLSKRVEAMRAGGDDLLDADFLEGREVGFGEHLEQVLVASSAGCITAAAFLHAENTDVEASFFHDADGVPGDLLVAFVKGGSTAREVDVFGWLGHLHVKAIGPIASLVGGQAVGVGIRFEVLDGGHERHDRILNALVKLHALHHQVATSIGQLGHVVDVNGASLNTGVAGGTSPNGTFAETGDDVFLGRFVGKQGRSVVVGVMAHVVDDLHRVEVLAAGVGGTNVLAASARGAGPAIDEVPPREIGVVHGTKRLHVEVVKQDGLAVFPTGQGLHGGHRAKVVKEDVREGHHQVHVLGKRDEEQENTDGEHVGPVGGNDEAGSGRQGGVDPVADGLPC